MKVGRGSLRSMLKVYRKHTAFGRSPLLYTSLLIVLSLGFVLAGCGQLSLTQLLENEEPGELSISPTNAIIPAAGTLDVTGKGGFKPYTYENKGDLGSINANTGEYIAPPESEISGTATTDIEVTDTLGSKVSTTITVFAPISLSPAAKTVEEGDSVDFIATGGLPDPDYEFYVDGDPKGTSTGSWLYQFIAEGTYTVEAVDSLGNSAVATITVDRHLAIEVADNWVLTGGSITVSALNQTSPHTFSIDPPGLADEVGWIENPSDVTATYHAPNTEMIVTIKLEDVDDNTTTVDIHVLSASPEPLAFPTTITVLVNATDQLTAIGGIEPHTFWLVGEGSLSPHPTQEHRIRYNAPSFPTTAYVWVQDELGRQAKATVHVVEG